MLSSQLWKSQPGAMPGSSQDLEGVTDGADTRQIADPPTISRSHRHGNPPASGPRFGRAPISIHVHKPTLQRSSAQGKRGMICAVLRVLATAALLYGRS
jgi:hypothetical protein